jgi:hypothetical protein
VICSSYDDAGVASSATASIGTVRLCFDPSRLSPIGVTTGPTTWLRLVSTIWAYTRASGSGAVPE